MRCVLPLGRVTSCVAVMLRLGLEQDLLIDPRVLLDPAADDARHRRRAAALGVAAAVAVAEIDPAVRRVIRIDRDVHHAALPHDERLGRPLDRLGEQSAIDHLSDRAGLLGDQGVRGAQERDAPRVVQPLGERLDVDGVILGLELARLLLARRLAPVGGPLERLDVVDHGVDLRVGEAALVLGHAGPLDAELGVAEEVLASSAELPVAVDHGLRAAAARADAVTADAGLLVDRGPVDRLGVREGREEEE
jgi:hypothetical protein